MDAVVSKVWRLRMAPQNTSSGTTTISGAALREGLLEPRDAAFALFRLAISMTNVGLDATEPVIHALETSGPDYFPEQAVSKLLHAMGALMRGRKLSHMPRWCKLLLQRGKELGSASLPYGKALARGKKKQKNPEKLWSLLAGF